MMKQNKYLWIFTILVSVLLVAPAELSAQRDTTGATSKTDSIIEYLTPLEYAFMMHEQTKFMLRLPGFGLGAEVEIIPYFTLMGQAKYGINPYYYYTEFKITTETRWYYGSKKKGIRNMSGNYVGLGYEYETSFPPEFDKSYPSSFYAKWGMQRRFLGAGLIDIGVNVGYKKITGIELYSYPGSTIESLFIRTAGSIGLGFVFNNEKALDKDLLCPALKCYERETFLLTINTLNLMSVEYTDIYKRSIVTTNPQIGIEQKLFNSAFSIGTNLKLNYEWVHTDNDIFYYNKSYSDWHARIQTRYYYNLKNRILKGKSGNGFSANYVSAGIYRAYYVYESDDLELQDNAFTLTTGIQRTFSDHLYFDLEIGAAIDLMRGDGIKLFGDVQIGIKF